VSSHETLKWSSNFSETPYHKKKACKPFLLWVFIGSSAWCLSVPEVLPWTAQSLLTEESFTPRHFGHVSFTFLPPCLYCCCPISYTSRDQEESGTLFSSIYFIVKSCTFLLFLMLTCLCPCSCSSEMLQVTTVITCWFIFNKIIFSLCWSAAGWK